MPRGLWGPDRLRKEGTFLVCKLPSLLSLPGPHFLPLAGLNELMWNLEQCWVEGKSVSSMAKLPAVHTGRPGVQDTWVCILTPLLGPA